MFRWEEKKWEKDRKEEIKKIESLVELNIVRKEMKGVIVFLSG